MKAFFNKLRNLGKSIGLAAGLLAVAGMIVGMMWTANTSHENAGDIAALDEHQRDTDALIAEYRIEIERLRGEVAILKEQVKSSGRWINHLKKGESFDSSR